MAYSKIQDTPRKKAGLKRKNSTEPINFCGLCVCMNGSANLTIDSLRKRTHNAVAYEYRLSVHC